MGLGLTAPNKIEIRFAMRCLFLSYDIVLLAKGYRTYTVGTGVRVNLRLCLFLHLLLVCN
jgi:hypothetical protein